MAQPKLFDRIGTYWDGRKANGVEGLALLDECIRRTASKDRDWDALARFVSRANESNNAAKVKKIIRAAFGNALVFQLDKKHPAGGRFTLTWEGPFPLAKSNSYGLVRDAIAKGVSWDDKGFLAELGKVIPSLPEKKKEVTEKATAKAADHLFKYIVERQAEGFDISAIMADVQSRLKAKAAADAKVTKRVVNGVEVIEPNF